MSKKKSINKETIIVKNLVDGQEMEVLQGELDNAEPVDPAELDDEQLNPMVGKLRNRICINGKWIEAGTFVLVTGEIKEYIDPATIKEA